jgi:hypothetical protein
MRQAALIVLVLLAAGVGLPGQAQTATDDAELHATTRQLAATISDAFESLYLLPAPLYVDWPARDDRPHSRGALVLFSLEGRNGGNSYSFYIAHFEHRALDEAARGDLKRDWMNYRLTDFIQVGEKFWRTLSWESARLTAEGVVIATQPWQRGDAGCCPTGKGAIRLDIDRRGRLSIVDLSPQ